LSKEKSEIEAKDWDDPVDWSLNQYDVSPGESSEIRFNIGRLPSGTPVHIHAIVHRSTEPGPRVLLLGGVHGDEICGVEIVRHCLGAGFLENLKRGSVISIPLLNIYGFINFSREVPDGKDVNRSFPGNARGSLASRVARTLTRKILPYTDVAMDFHTGGASRYNYPQIRYSEKSEESRKLAEVFAAPFTIPKTEIKGSFRKETMKRSIPTLVYEGGEALRLDGFAIERGVNGLKRVLKHYDMIDDDVPIPASTTVVKASTWVRAPEAGLFRWSKSSGSKIKKGEPIGSINDPYGAKKIVISAPSSGYIIGHNNAPVVNVGDALFHLASLAK